MHEYKYILFKNQKDIDPKCPTWEIQLSLSISQLICFQHTTV